MGRVIISTGQGRLHLIESAKAVKISGFDVDVVTGWVPSIRIPDKLLDFLGYLLGRKNLSDGLRKRRLDNLKDTRMYTCSFSEFYIQFLFLLSKWNLLKRDTAAIAGWRLYGFQSKTYIKNADVFHLRSGAGRGGAIRTARAAKMKIIVDHSIAHPQEMYNQILKSLDGNTKDLSLITLKGFWDLVLEDCKEADVLVVNSDYVKESFLANGFSKNKIEVIPLGIKSLFWNLKKEYDINDKTKLLFTGSFGRRKGAHLIIEAFKLLISKSDNYSLDVLGSIMNDIHIPDWFKNHKNVRLHGHVPQEQMLYFLKTSDIYIFPSYTEGAAQSLKEAMASGLPVIATRQSGAPIINKENGLIIGDHSSRELIQAIRCLENDQFLRHKIGQNAYLTISKRHTWGIYGDKMTNLYLQQG
jgi:glycosyltransferase involved in cell wall biosynthesis